MKAKILDKDICNIDQRFKVLSMNYDFVMLQINSDKKIVRREAVELIPENNYEDIFSEYADILKIKLDKGITPGFYPTLISYIENIIGRKIEQIDTLEDSYRFIKKGIWEKKLLLVINKLRIFEISVIGQKYGDNFSFTIKEIDLIKFCEECEAKVESLKNEIKKNIILKKKYEKTLKNIINNRINMKEPILLES
jgi:hypothetical protein